MPRPSLSAIGAAVALLSLPATGHAAEVGLVTTVHACPVPACGDTYSTSRLVYRAAPGEANRVGYAIEPGRIVFTESSGAPLTAGPGCQERLPGTVACDSSPGPRIETGDGADVVELQGGGTTMVLMSIDGGAGDDVLVGGPADDTLNGGGGRDELHGGGGEDDLDDGDGRRGDADTLDGGPGGGDEVFYRDRTADLDVDLDRPAGPDGDTLVALEGVTGGSGDDRLTASSRRSGVLDGGKGSDTLRGRARSDSLFGSEGRDVLVGGAGADDLNGGIGRDRVSGGPGPDEIDTGDATSELVRCGSGRDLVGGTEDNEFNDSTKEVGPDAADRLAGDCEAIRTESETRPIPVHPLRVGADALRVRNACRPCSTATVTIRIGKRIAARGRLAGRRTARLAWRRPPSRRVNARVAWDFRDELATDYAFTIRLRIP